MAKEQTREEWKLAADWLVRCKILAGDHKVTWLNAEVFDLAQTLRDGVLMCYLLNALKPGVIDLKDFSQRPQMSQFLCLKNIRIFLHTCEGHFGMRETELFKPDDLFDMKDFGKVISTLSKLSKIAEPTARIAGFPPTNVALRWDSDYYNTLEELITGFSDRLTQRRNDDKIYEGLANRASDVPDDDIYDAVNQDDDHEIYDDILAMQRKTPGADKNPKPVVKCKQARVTGFFEPKSQRDYCIKELVETERNYVEALYMIIRHFIRPLKTVLSPEDHKLIFLHVEGLHEVHTGFQSELQKACSPEGNPSDSELSDCFTKWKPKFLIYGEFCSNLPHAQERVDEICRKNQQMLQSIEKCQMEANEGKFRLRDLLSVPMQRVLKYHLLLKELIKKTEDTHVERRGLERALEAMQDLSLYVNEVKRDNEGLQLIQEIQSSILDLVMPENTSLKDYGKLLKDGELRIKSHDDNKVKTRYIFLFDKVMLMCKSRGATFSFKNALILSQHRVEEGSNLQRSKSDKGSPYSRTEKYNTWGSTRNNRQPRGFTFLLVEKKEQHAYTLQAKTEELKRKWIDAIIMALDNMSPPGCKQGNHDFIMFSFDQPTTCDVCGKLLRGVFYQGYRCQASQMKVHKECIMKAPPVPINGAAPQLPPRPLQETQMSQRPTVTPSRPRAVIGKCKANYGYQGNLLPDDNRPVIKFEVNDVIDLLSKDDQYWWEGRINGQEGFFPAQYVVMHRAKMLKGPSYEGPIVLQGNRPGDGTPKMSLRQVMQTSSNGPASPTRLWESDTPSSPTDSLTPYPWYVGEMSREVAVQRLEKHVSGSYLIRSSINRKGEYALSIKFGSSVKHIKVNRTTTDNMFYLADCKLFRSIPELVEYYQKNTLKYSFPELVTELVLAYKDAARQMSTVRPGASAGPTILGYCIANFDYSANQPNQLSLRRSDRIAIISKAGEDRGWWKGQLRGKIGYFPLAYVVEEGDENLLAAHLS